MKTRTKLVLVFALALTLVGAALMAQQAGRGSGRPQGPCDIYAAASDPCVAAHSTTRALYAAYNGPLYQVVRQSDGKTQDIGVVQPNGSDAGGYANAAAQDTFCANTYCWISTIYDQSGKKNHLTQAPRGAFSGNAMGGFNNLPVADMAPITIMGHKAYGAFIAPGMGLRQNDVHGTAVDDQAEGQYWVINGQHYNNGCCFDYGNAEIDSRDDDNGTMETTYYGNATAWYHGNPPGPWIMTDQENNLVGCVNPGSTSKLCESLPNITWRFVTAMAKGEPHHWTSMGGDSQKGELKVMFDGPRVDHTYDPMRKKGAILLGNGGDNSVGSQGTFYEGAMTAAGTFPTNATDQLVQANVVAAKYDVARVSVAPASAAAAPTGLQTFAPSTSQDTIVAFTNTTGAPVTGLKLSITVPKGWTATASGASTFDSVAPGASVNATFKVTSAAAAFNGDLTGTASYTAGGKTNTDSGIEKVRNVAPVKINEFRISAGPSVNTTNSFIELYNAGANSVDIAGWTLTQHQNQQATFSNIRIPAGTKLTSHGFYLLGLSTSGLVVPARKGETTLYVRSTAGLNAGDTITIGTGTNAETRKLAKVGTAASAPTTVWQPLPDGPVVTFPKGSVNLPVTSIAGFAVGEKIALGHGAQYPAVAREKEQYEIATVTEIGKPGVQAFLGVDAKAGSSNISVTNVSTISVGDKIRLDVDTMGHGVETVTVTKVGTPAVRGSLAAEARAGATNIRMQIRGGGGGQPGGTLTVGGKMTIGTPANAEIVTIKAVDGNSVDITPALTKSHLAREFVVAHGTGLDIAAPLKFNHAGNLPFSARGTGVTFKPESGVSHLSNEPVQALGTGITLDGPLAKDHAIDDVVSSPTATAAGYQGTPAPNQWFGGPALSQQAGAMVLRDAAGLVVDSLNYGLLSEPWAGEGYHGKSGTGEGGCRVPSPGAAGGRGNAGFGGQVPATSHNRSAGRITDGLDTDSNCTDFAVQPATTLSAASTAGTNNIKVASVADLAPGQTLIIDSEGNQETAAIATVGTAGATTTTSDVAAGATSIPVANPFGFAAGQSITVGNGSSQETAVVSAVAGGGRGGGGGGRGGAGASITVNAPLKNAHPSGAQVSGSGITLSGALTKAHAGGALVTSNLATPGAPNKYDRKR